MKLDASVLGAVERREPMDVQKLSSSVGAGNVIETVSGQRYFVASKIAGADGTVFRLTTPDESFYVTANQLADMEPLPSGLVRLAHVLRFYAYNRDFDLYVKEAIKSHRLPIDHAMDWSKWFEKIYAPMLRQYMQSKGLRPTPELLDEVIHSTIIDALYTRDNLSKFPKGQKGKGKGYTESRARQVTKFLSNLFEYEKSKAKREVIRMTNVVPHFEHGGTKGQGMAVPMEQTTKGEEGEEEHNILETEEFATSPREVPEDEPWDEIAEFRAQYAGWLKDKEGPQVVDNLMKLLDLIVYAEKESGSELSRLSDYRNRWMAETGKSISYYQLIAAKLAESLEAFVNEHPELAETSLFARLIADIKSKKPTTRRKVEGPKAASLALAAAAPSDTATIPGDTGRLPHDNTGNTSDAVVLIDELEDQPPQRTVKPEVPSIVHGI